jgi:hypothetical protein
MRETASIKGNFNQAVETISKIASETPIATGATAKRNKNEEIESDAGKAGENEASDIEILEWLQQSAAKLPVVAVAVYEALDVLCSSPVDLDKFIAIVGSEPGLAAQIVRLAAADTTDGWYSLKDAVVLAGVADMQRLLIEVPLITPSDPAYGKLTMFRRRAQLTAKLSETIAAECEYRRTEEAYLSGLLHDIGKLPGLTHAVKPIADHARIGVTLARWWRFPENLLRVYQWQPGPATDGSDGFVSRAVWLAEDFCARMGVLTDGAGGCRDNLGSVELVRHYLPLLPPYQQTSLAEMMESEARRWTEQWLRSARAQMRPSGAYL